MARGYLVRLGDGSLGAGDVISGPTIGFVSATTLGTGSWTWSGVTANGGNIVTDNTDTGTYHQALDGNVYFVPDTDFASDLSSASVTTNPVFEASVFATSSDETIESGGADDLLYGGTDTSGTGTGADTIFSGAGQDVIFAGDGDDVIDTGAGADTAYGGDGDDTLHGDGTSSATSNYEVLRWELLGGDGTDVSAGFSQDTGGVSVMVDFNNDGNLTGATISTEEQFTGFGFTDFDSSVRISGDNSLLDDETALDEEYPPTATISLVFTADAGSGLSNEVTDVDFIINDIDSGVDGWIDQVTVNAYDSNGNPVEVNIFPAFLSDTLDGQTVTGGPGDDTPDSEEGAAQVEIAGPVHYIEIIYTNEAEGAQDIWLTDVGFNTEPAFGGLDANALFGDAGDDVIYGGFGDELLDGGTGQDSIYGGFGNDTLVGGADNDRLEGEEGDDTLSATSGRNLMFGGSGEDTFYGGSDTDLQYGGNQDDILFGNAGNDSLFAGNGDDNLDGGDGNDRLTAGGGNDTAFGGQGRDFLIGQSGNDTLYGGLDDDTVDGGTGNDSLFGGDGSDTLVGNDGDDHLYGGDHNDTLFGGDGDDSIHGDQGNDDIQGGDGNDYLFGSEGDDTVAGNNGDDTLEGWFGQDQLSGEAGNDVLDGAQDSDTLFGGFGNDTLLGGQDDAADTLFGGAGDDSLLGGDGNDVLDGDIGADTAFGGDGDDRFVLSDDFGADEIRGGEGAETNGDVLDASNVTDDLTLDLTAFQSGNPEFGTLSDGTSTAQFEEIEQVILGSGDDSIIGSAGDDHVFGGAGNDSTTGSAGDDQFYGGDGDDSLLEGTGNTTLSGDAGDDYLGLTNSGDTTAYGGTGSDFFAAGTNTGVKTIIGGEDADGSDFDQAFVGFSSSDHDVTVTFTDSETGAFTKASGGTGTFSEIEQILLGIGDDTVDGAAAIGGFDVNTGGGDDTLTGSDFADTLTGGGGSDTLYSGAGADTLNLGFDGDADVIVLNDGDGDDLITGFDMPIDNGDGTYMPVDTFDTTGLTNFDGSQVSIDDISIGADANGHAVLAFPNGASITLSGVSVTEIDNADILQAIGFPLENQIVEGSSGDDLINGEYIDDPEGDLVDNSDALDGSNDDLIEAYGGNDTAFGGTGNDTIFGGAGNDSVIGEDGDDTLFGGDGVDFLNGVGGSDTLFGGAGDDFLESGEGNDQTFGDAGDDSLNGDLGEDQVFGGAGNDFVRGSFGNDTVYGGEGDDFVWGGFGDDIHIVENDFGNDTYFGDSEQETFGDTLDLSAVTDDLTIDLRDGVPEIGSFTDGTFTATFEEIEHITLGSGTDTLILADTSGSDQVSGFEAPTLNPDGTYTPGDLLDVTELTSDFGDTPVNVTDVVVSDDGNGNATLTFPGGENITLIGVTPAAINTPLALEAIGIPINNGVVDGTTGNDTIDIDYIGDTDGDRIDNNDAVLAGTSGNDDVVFADLGNDTISSGDGDDNIHGEEGDDDLFGGVGNDSLYGGTGDDTLDGDLGDDLLFGGDGDDTFATNAQNGASTIVGGENLGDVDLIELGQVTGETGAEITFDGAESGTLSLGLGTSAIFSEIEQINTTDADDTVDASLNTSDVTIFANSGDDVVIGGAGNDTLHGEEGDDTVSGGDGDDHVQGDAGNDSLAGGDGNDIIIGDSGNDLIAGGDGDDEVFAGTGDDTVSAGSGNDFIDTAEGTDTITLADNAGDNTLFGGTGDTETGDTLDGALLTEAVTLTQTGTGRGTFASSGGTSSYEQIEFIITGSGNDTFIGSDNRSDIFTGAGDDVFTSGGGADQLDGGAGNDVFNIDGNDGENSIDGGTGIDTLSFSESLASNVDLTFDGDSEGVYTGDAATVGGFSNIESVEGTDFADTIDADLDSAGVTLSGLGGADTLTGGTGDDTIFGGDGNDTINYGDGDNTVFGGAGDDFIDDIGGIEVSGDDVLYAGAGNDRGFSGNNDDIIYAGTGNDDFIAGAGADTLYAGDGDDYLEGGSGNDIFFGGAGDTLDGGNDADLFVINTAELDGSGGTSSSIDIIGGAGGIDDDTLDLTQYAFFTGLTETADLDGNSTSGSVTVTDEFGASRLVTFTEIETLLLPSNGDTFDGTVQGTSGDDVIDLAYVGDLDGDRVDATDAILPGHAAQDDLIYALGGNDVVTSGFGGDTVYGGDGTDTIFGEDGSDTLFGGDGDDTLSGGIDNDSLSGDEGNDTLSGGDGDDTIDGGAGQNTLFGDDGDDTITTTSGEDIAFGGNGTDHITGGVDNDQLFGNAGSDTIFGGAGDDFIGGGNGGIADTGTVDDSQSNDSLYGGTGNDSIHAGRGDDLVEGGAGDDTLFGFSENDEIYGGDGNDTIDGGADNDSLYGGEGRDTFIVTDNFGDDVVVGGGEFDAINLSALSNPVSVVFSAPGVGTITDTVTGDTIAFSEIEHLILTPHADSVNATNDDGYTYIEAREGNDEIIGSDGNDIYDDELGSGTALDGAGDDTYFGNDGDDTLFVGNDNDEAFGGDGNDTIYGQEGNDYIQGDAGSDVLHGNEGRDLFFIAEGDTAFGDEGDDTFFLDDLGEDSKTITIDGGDDDANGDTLNVFGRVDVQDVLDAATDDGTGSLSGSVLLDSGTLLNFSDIENIICFTPGTHIATPQGARAIETLAIGDLVVTRDHGLRPIRWIGQRTVRGHGKFAPIRLRPGVTPGLSTDLLVSPQHRMLFQGHQAELLFGSSEVLVPAKHLIDGLAVTQDDVDSVTYIHMMFDEHEIVFAEGAATESFHPGEVGMDAITDACREELFAIFPELRVMPNSYGGTARRCLRKHEAVLLRG